MITRFPRGNLTLGDTYRRMKDYEKAEKYILEGLEGVKKVGDKYWEAVQDIAILACYTKTRETKRLPKITSLVPMVCLNPSVRKGMLRESFLKYKSLKRKSSYIRRLSHEESLQPSFHHPQPFSL
jgi:hypothetical protein